MKPRLFDKRLSGDLPCAQLILSPDPVDGRSSLGASRGEVPGIAAGIDLEAVEPPVIPVAAHVERLQRNFGNSPVDGLGKIQDVLVITIMDLALSGRRI